MRARAVCGFLLVLTMTPAAERQRARVPARVVVAARSITAAQLQRDVEYLASDALRGRATPSPELDSAAAYIVARLTRLGLRPAGDSGTYLQHYTVAERTLDTTATVLEVGGRRLRFGTDLLVAGMRDSSTVSGPLVYVGHGWRAPRWNIDPYAGVDVRGKILVVHGPGVFPPGVPRTAMTVLGDATPAQLVATERGAIGVLFLLPPRVESRWETSRGAGSFLTSRDLEPRVPILGGLQASAALWLRQSVAETLFAGAARTAADVLAGAASGNYVPSFDLPASTRATIRIATLPVKRFRSYNVVATIVGNDARLRNEVVMLQAHLDGAHEMAQGTDTIFNAADDNASGSAALLSIASALMQAPRARRTVMFVWDTGEETGLWGSRFFAANPPLPVDRIAADINVDMIGRSRQPGSSNPRDAELSGPNEVYVVGPRVLSSALDSLLERANRALPGLELNHRYDVATHEFFYPRTDAAPLLERGVLTLDVFTGLHGDYHAPSDEVGRLDPQKMEKVSRTVFATAWLIADATTRPAIDKGLPSNVRRAR